MEVDMDLEVRKVEVKIEMLEIEEKQLRTRFSEMKSLLAEVNEIIAVKVEKARELSEKISKHQEDDENMNDPGDGNVSKNRAQNEMTAYLGQARTAETILPEEVWTLILEKYSNSPKDWYNSMKTCQLFWTILEPSKNVFLFDLVFPCLYNYLDRNTILKCRSICKRWSSVVDNFFERHPSLLPYPEDGAHDPTHPAFVTPMDDKKIGLYFQSEFSMNHPRKYFVTQMEDHPRNPFIGRAISISHFNAAQLFPENFHFVEQPVPDQGGFNPFGLFDRIEQGRRRKWQAINNFLEKFGRHIWTFSFTPGLHDFTRSGVPAIRNFLTGDLFSYLHKLRHLSIKGCLGEDVESSFPVNVHSIPDAEHLETLAVDNVVHSCRSHPILLALVKRFAHQLQRLHVTGGAWSLHLSQLSFNFLTELHIEGITTGELVSGLQNVPFLETKLGSLRKLGLSLSRGDGGNLKTLLEVLNKLFAPNFLPKLDILRLSFRTASSPFPESEIASLPPTLYAPLSLKTLEIQSFFPDIVPGPASVSLYTFLTRFPLLENINVHWSRSRDFELELVYIDGGVWFDRGAYLNEEIKKELDNEVVQIQKYMFEHRMYESNVWKIFPRLKVFTFQKEALTRPGYKHFLEVNAARRKTTSAANGVM